MKTTTRIIDIKKSWKDNFHKNTVLKYLEESAQEIKELENLKRQGFEEYDFRIKALEDKIRKLETEYSELKEVASELALFYIMHKEE